ncbi:MAG: hypothetical protein K8T91_16280 [Planctomycetes bacterium]|nr:hypothetical protein [Planctomycetota bacterium]
MTVTFRCPRCEQTVKATLTPMMTSLECPQCQATASVPEGAMSVGEAEGKDQVAPSQKGRRASSHWQLHRCLVCPSRDLFVRKDFPQRLGIAIVVVGFAGFLAANFFYLKYLAFGFLFATALIDVFLYFWVGEALVCYRCGAHYRGVEDLGDHAGFELETHERYRQMAARMAEAGVDRHEAKPEA